jgi:hypothetical protein
VIARTSHQVATTTADMAMPASLRSVGLLDVLQRIRLCRPSRDHVVRWNGTHVAVVPMPNNGDLPLLGNSSQTAAARCGTVTTISIVS